jgi:ABC-2 type transport system permease protein
LKHRLPAPRISGFRDVVALSAARQLRWRLRPDLGGAWPGGCLSSTQLTSIGSQRRIYGLGHPGLLAVNLWRYRNVLWYLILRNLRSQYKKSLFGYAWIFLNPLSQLLVFAFVFSTILKTPSQHNVSFTLFILVGLIPWIFLSNAVMSATDSITGGGSLVTMVYFPREVLTTAAVLTRVVDLAAGLVILAVALIVEGQSIGFSALWVLPALFVQILFTLGLAFPLAALNLFFHDVRFLVAVGLNLWFFLSPIMYPPDIVPEAYAPIYDLNPLARLVNTYRYAIFTGVAPPLDSLLVATAMSLFVISIGYYVFKKMEPAFADNV